MDIEKINNDQLRERAEKLLKKQFKDLKDQTIDEYVHELQVQQIELELQNEELREAQLKLEDSRHRYFDLYNFAPVGYFTLNKEGIISDVNLAGAALLDVEKLYLNNTPFIKYITPDHQNKFHHLIMKVLETGTKQSIEIKLLKANNPFYANLETINVTDEHGNFKEFRITVTDINDLINTGKALKDSEERYREIFYNNHVVMLLIDPDSGNILDANPAASTFYGYTFDELIKMKISDFKVSDRELVREEMQKAVSKQKNHFIFKQK